MQATNAAPIPGQLDIDGNVVPPKRPSGPLACHLRRSTQWETIGATAVCCECDWAHFGRNHHETVDAARYHAKVTGHQVNANRTQVKRVDPTPSAAGYLHPSCQVG